MPGLRLVVDVDTGVDDAQAIMLALGHPHLAEVTAITCVGGNTCLDNVCRNTLTLLTKWDRLDVPVYRGCARPMLGERLTAEHHGKTGFGNMPVPSSLPLEDLLQSEHAASALVRLVKENPGELTLVAVGPLTNIAMALKLHPQLGQDLKQAYIMGGNIEGKGNITPAAEFNFACDPEAAFVVLNELSCPITLLPWETGWTFGNDWAFQDEVSSYGSSKAQFYSALTAFGDQRCKAIGKTCNTMCDPLTMASLLDPTVVTKATSEYCVVEQSGEFTRGQMVVDWRRFLGKDPNVTIIHKVDMKKVQALYRTALKD